MLTTVQQQVMVVTSRELQKCVIVAGDEATLEQIQLAFEIAWAESNETVLLIPSSSVLESVLAEGWQETDLPLLAKNR